jgi:5-methylcytosine-specific restriction endonuclease McrA
MDASTRSLVRSRAGNCCEYCRLPQSAVPLATFHVEHVRAQQHGGSDDSHNLALACQHCNLHKGPNLAGIDPETDQIVPLFNPRRDVHSEHFAFRGTLIVGLTPTGRATVNVLAMNSDEQLDIRSALETA